MQPVDTHIDVYRVGLGWELSPPNLYKYIEFISNVFYGYARIINETKLLVTYLYILNNITYLFSYNLPMQMIWSKIKKVDRYNATSHDRQVPIAKQIILCRYMSICAMCDALI